MIGPKNPRNPLPPKPRQVSDGMFSKTGYAYDTLRRQILDGGYQPGDRLRLAHIARELQLSEMPVREALRLLQKDGLVVMNLHRGAQVASLSFTRALEVTEVRMQLECVATIGAMPFHDEVSLAALGRMLGEMHKAVDRPVRFALKNREFCTRLFERCPNAFLRQHIQDLWDQVWQYSSVSVFELMRSRMPETIEENRSILDTIPTGNAARLQLVFERRASRTVEGWRAAIAKTLTIAPTRRAAGKPQRSSAATVSATPSKA